MPDWEQREAIEAAVLAAKAPKPGLKTDDTAIPLGSAAYWFVDDHALANASNLRIEVQRPSDPAAWRTVLVADKPWELGPGCYWGGTSIVRLPDTGRVRLYYVIRNCTGTTFKGFPKGDRWAVTAIAESEDGIVFTKPTLGLAGFRGTEASRTNLVAMTDGSPCLYCDSVFLDPNGARFKSCTKNERISEVTGTLGAGSGSRDIPLKPGSLTCVQSHDGLRWEVLGSMFIGSIDTQTNMLWDPARGQYGTLL